MSALRRALTAPPGSSWRDPAVWVIAALAFGAYFAISLFRLLQLAPASYDLGIYTEFVRQLSQFHAPIDNIVRPGEDLEGDHFQIAVGVIAPFFRLFPSAATLLFFQALFAAVSVFPVATAATLLTGRNSGRLIAFAYAFSWGLQQMIDFDFHEVALAVPLLAFSLSALVRRRPGAAIGWAMPLVFVKEDQGFTLAAIGALLCASALSPRLLPVGATPAAAQPQPPTGEDGTPLPDSAQDYRYAALWGGLFLVGWGLLAFQFPLSDLWHSSTYTVNAHVAAADAAMAVVPDGVTVTTTTDLLAPLAARTDTFWIENSGNPPTQYIVFDGGPPPGTNVPAFIAQYYGKDGYKQVFERNNVYVYRRG